MPRNAASGDFAGVGSVVVVQEILRRSLAGFRWRRLQVEPDTVHEHRRHGGMADVALVHEGRIGVLRINRSAGAAVGVERGIEAVAARNVGQPFGPDPGLDATAGGIGKGVRPGDREGFRQRSHRAEKDRAGVVLLLAEIRIDHAHPVRVRIAGQWVVNHFAGVAQVHQNPQG